MKSTTSRTLIALAWAIGLWFLVASTFDFYPGQRGLHAIAAALFLGAGLIARAILDHAAAGRPQGKPHFVPENLMADALDRRDD